MLKGAVARRYAGAVFDLARRQNTLDRTLTDVQGIADLFSNRKISFLMREPKVPAQRKEKALRDALQSRVLPTSLNFALLLVQRELVEYAPNISKELEQLVRDYRNEAIADVTTAAKIDAVQSDTIQRSLEQRTGKSIIIREHIDPAILGGVVARVGDEVIDGSVRYRLSVLQQQMLSGVANSHTDFFSKAELDETVRDIGSVDMNSHATNSSTSTDGQNGADDNDNYNPVPRPNNS